MKYLETDHMNNGSAIPKGRMCLKEQILESSMFVSLVLTVRVRT